MARKSRRERLLDQYAEQQKWIERCGGSLPGHIRHYGNPGVPPLDEEGEPKTISCPDDLATRCGLVPLKTEKPISEAPEVGTSPMKTASK